jgi:hypothetical protein
MLGRESFRLWRYSYLWLIQKYLLLIHKRQFMCRWCCWSSGISGGFFFNAFSATKDELSIAGGGTGGTGVGQPSSSCSFLDTTQSILIGDDVLGLVLTKDGLSNLLGLSVMICRAFEFGVVWETGATLGSLSFEGAVRRSLGLLVGLLLTIDLGSTGRASAGFGGASFGGAIGGASSRKLTRCFRFVLCCNLAFG